MIKPATQQMDINNIVASIFKTYNTDHSIKSYDSWTTSPPESIPPPYCWWIVVSPLSFLGSCIKTIVGHPTFPHQMSSFFASLRTLLGRQSLSPSSASC
jgi:hypothetical protein